MCIFVSHISHISYITYVNDIFILKLFTTEKPIL